MWFILIHIEITYLQVFEAIAITIINLGFVLSLVIFI